LLAFVELNSGYGDEIGTLPLRSVDDGITWTAGRLEWQLSTAAIAGLAQASNDAEVLYLATRDNRAAEEFQVIGRAGVVLQTQDGGLSWTRLVFTESWTKWESFSAVAANPARPGVIAVALAPGAEGVRLRPQGVPGVLLTTDRGHTWRLLSDGLHIDSDTEIYLAGLARSGELVAVLRRGRAETGSMVIWRPLHLLERLQGRFGT
jgi:hypothetical protein